MEINIDDYKINEKIEIKFTAIPVMTKEIVDKMTNKELDKYYKILSCIQILLNENFFIMGNIKIEKAIELRRLNDL